MKILTVSDIEVPFLYSPIISQRCGDVDMIISCGDLPYYYLEYMLSMLDVPLYYVRGNHASKIESTSGGDRTSPWGGIDLHRSCKHDQSGMLLAGIEGSIRYNNGPNQYSQGEMWLIACNLVPALLINRIRFGRYLDILVTHSPPWKIHDGTDPPHIGIKAFRWLIDVFKPLYHLHGHIHIYRQDTIVETVVGQTHVLNTYGYRVLDLHSKYFSGFR
ncbi:MAG: metallophosphoesterase [Anaerolineaceae bacterium]|jgi:hypothetical protein